MIEDDDDVQQGFSTDEFGEAATFAAGSGSTAVFTIPDGFGVVFDLAQEVAGLGDFGAMQRSYKIIFPVAWITADPAEGDTWTLRGLTFNHGNATLDPSGKIWTVNLNKQGTR